MTKEKMLEKMLFICNNSRKGNLQIETDDEQEKQHDVLLHNKFPTSNESTNILCGLRADCAYHRQKFVTIHLHTAPWSLFCTM